ncbi:hypothetical protein [Caballeronia sp. S22]|uniref:hypothetical protein n=1 Tax=Caballeronia sp. S22 TaxID=3137182 RepID=UPI00353098FA
MNMAAESAGIAPSKRMMSSSPCGPDAPIATNQFFVEQGIDFRRLTNGATAESLEMAHFRRIDERTIGVS